MEQVRRDRFEVAGPAKEPAAYYLDTHNSAIACAVVTSDEEILALEVAWRALEAQCPDTVLFQSFDWCCNHLQFSRIIKENGDQFKPRIITLHKGKQLVGLLPLCLQSKGRLKVLTGFSEPFQQYTEMLLAPRLDLTETRKALAEIFKSLDADYFHFG